MSTGGAGGGSRHTPLLQSRGGQRTEEGEEFCSGPKCGGFLAWAGTAEGGGPKAAVPPRDTKPTASERPPAPAEPVLPAGGVSEPSDQSTTTSSVAAPHGI